MTDSRYPIVTERAGKMCYGNTGMVWFGFYERDNYSKKPYTIFCDTFEYPGQPHEVAIWGSEFPGTHHLHRVNDRERVTKGTYSGTTNCTLLQPQDDSRWIDLWELEWQLRPATLVWMGLFPLQWQKRAALVAVNHCLLTKTIQLHGAADPFFSKLCCELLFYSLNQASFILSPAFTWKNIQYTPIYNLHGST